jgi:predicted nuclease with TOPRIM domain
MNEPNYTVKEIMELQFKGLDAKLDDIRHTLKDQNIQTEKRFLRLDAEVSDLRKEIQELKQENARYKVMWGVGATIGASMIAVFVNRFIL